MSLFPIFRTIYPGQTMVDAASTEKLMCFGFLCACWDVYIPCWYLNISVIKVALLFFELTLTSFQTFLNTL